MREKIKISIIILSFNDIRVLEAIKSVQAFNDNNEVAIIVIDGGSEDELVKEINSMLSKEDLLISEKDNGIFDGLNKGLNYSKGDYIGWLGSDDFFSSQFNKMFWLIVFSIYIFGYIIYINICCLSRK